MWTSHPICLGREMLLSSHSLPALSATSGSCTQDVSIISTQACTDLGVAPPLECRGCLELINLSLPLQGMKNNPTVKTRAWSSGNIFSSLLLCMFPFWPWPRDLLCRSEELCKAKVWHNLTLFWLPFLIHLVSAACIVSVGTQSTGRIHLIIQP